MYGCECELVAAITVPVNMRIPSGVCIAHSAPQFLEKSVDLIFQLLDVALHA